MTLPNAERAIVDIRKLRDYCLNLLHEEGQHKARLFAITLGMTADDAEDLRDLLLEGSDHSCSAPGATGYLRATLHSRLSGGMARQASHDSEWMDYRTSYRRSKINDMLPTVRE
jgi:hypothetical protein